MRSFCFALALALTSCAPVDGDLSETTEDVDELVSNPQHLAFVTLRRDLRRCVAPLCGGFWVRRLNRSTMRCADGGYASECYVGRVDWSGLNLDDAALEEFQGAAAEGRAVLRGRIDPMRDPRWSQVGELVAAGGWRPVNGEAFTGPVWTVSDAGLRCVTTPCFSLRATRVNVASSSTSLSGLDLTGVRGIAPTVADELRAGLSREGETALFAGAVATVGRGRVLRATQAWQQVSAPIAPAAFCTDDTQCTSTVLTRDVASVADCFCPFCPTATVTTETATTRERAFRRHCSAFRERCPVPRCAAPPPVACVNHACAFAPLR